MVLLNIFLGCIAVMVIGVLSVHLWAVIDIWKDGGGLGVIEKMLFSMLLIVSVYWGIKILRDIVNIEEPDK